MSERDEVVVSNDTDGISTVAQVDGSGNVVFWRCVAGHGRFGAHAIAHSAADVFCAWWLKRQGIDVEALRARVSDLEDDVAHLRSAEQEEHADLVRACGTIEELRAERDRLREKLVRLERVADANECECDGDGPVGARCVVCQLYFALGAKEGTNG